MAVFSGNGSNTSPSFTFSSDTNTGLYRVDADKLGIATAGTMAITVDASQKVGFGTTSPDDVIHLRRNVPAIKFDGTAGTGSSHRIVTSGANDQDLQILVADEFYINSNIFRFRSQDQSTQFLGVSGATGYFSVAPSAGGHAVFNDNSADADFRVESDTNAYAIFVNSGVGRVSINSSGNDSSCSFLVEQSNSVDSAAEITRSQSPGTDGYAGHWERKVVYVAPNSSNTQLRIGLRSRSFNQSQAIRITVTPAQRNSSTNNRCGDAFIAFSAGFPNTITTNLLSNTGNITSVTGDSTTTYGPGGAVLVNFSNNYSDASIGGLFLFIEAFGQQRGSGLVDFSSITLN